MFGFTVKDWLSGVLINQLDMQFPSVNLLTGEVSRFTFAQPSLCSTFGLPLLALIISCQLLVGVCV